MTKFDHIVGKAVDAANGGWAVQSTEEKLMAALVLNRPDWLSSMGYTIAEAIARVGTSWVSVIPEAARAVAEDERTVTTPPDLELARAVLNSGIPDSVIDAAAALIDCGVAPGYRDVALLLAVRPLGAEQSYQARLRFDATNSMRLTTYLLETHRLAWASDQRPLDAAPGEHRPDWVRL